MSKLISTFCMLLIKGDQMMELIYKSCCKLSIIFNYIKYEVYRFKMVL